MNCNDVMAKLGVGPERQHDPMVHAAVMEWMHSRERDTGELLLGLVRSLCASKNDLMDRLLDKMRREPPKPHYEAVLQSWNNPDPLPASWANATADIPAALAKIIANGTLDLAPIEQVKAALRKANGERLTVGIVSEFFMCGCCQRGFPRSEHAGCIKVDKPVAEQYWLVHICNECSRSDGGPSTAKPRIYDARPIPDAEPFPLDKRVVDANGNRPRRCLLRANMQNGHVEAYAEDENGNFIIGEDGRVKVDLEIWAAPLQLVDIPDSAEVAHRMVAALEARIDKKMANAAETEALREAVQKPANTKYCENCGVYTPCNDAAGLIQSGWKQVFNYWHCPACSADAPLTTEANP